MAMADIIMQGGQQTRQAAREGAETGSKIITGFQQVAGEQKRQTMMDLQIKEETDNQNSQSALNLVLESEGGDLGAAIQVLTKSGDTKAVNAATLMQAQQHQAFAENLKSQSMVNNAMGNTAASLRQTVRGMDANQKASTVNEAIANQATQLGMDPGDFMETIPNEIRSNPDKMVTYLEQSSASNRAAMAKSNAASMTKIKNDVYNMTKDLENMPEGTLKKQLTQVRDLLYNQEQTQLEHQLTENLMEEFKLDDQQTSTYKNNLSLMYPDALDSEGKMKNVEGMDKAIGMAETMRKDLLKEGISLDPREIMQALKESGGVGFNEGGWFSDDKFSTAAKGRMKAMYREIQKDPQALGRFRDQQDKRKVATEMRTRGEQRVRTKGKTMFTGVTADKSGKVTVSEDRIQDELASQGWEDNEKTRALIQKGLERMHASQVKK